MPIAIGAVIRTFINLPLDWLLIGTTCLMTMVLRADRGLRVGHRIAERLARRLRVHAKIYRRVTHRAPAGRIDEPQTAVSR